MADATEVLVVEEAEEKEAGKHILKNTPLGVFFYAQIISLSGNNTKVCSRSKDYRYWRRRFVYSERPS